MATLEGITTREASRQGGKEAKPLLQEAFQESLAELDDVLISRENRKWLTALVGSLSGFDPGCFILEFRVGSAEPSADFSLVVPQRDGWRKSLEHREPGEEFPRTAAVRSAWERVSVLYQAGLLERSDTDPGVQGLEFDAKGNNRGAPSIFVTLPFSQELSSGINVQKDQGAAAYDFAEKMLATIGVNPAQPALFMLRELLQMTSLQAKRFLLGVWLGRQDTPLRLVIRDLPLTKTEELIRNLPGPGWREFVLPYSDFLNSLGIGMVSPAFDMGENVEKIGVEFFLGEQDTSWEEEVRLCRGLLDWLVQTGMCLPEKRDAVSSWFGGTNWSRQKDPFLRVLHREGLYKFVRKLSHGKLVLRPGESPQVKIYLSHMVLPADADIAETHD